MMLIELPLLPESATRAEAIEVMKRNQRSAVVVRAGASYRVVEFKQLASAPPERVIGSIMARIPRLSRDFRIVGEGSRSGFVSVETRSEVIGAALSEGPADWYCAASRPHHFSNSDLRRLKQDARGRYLCDRCGQPLSRLN